MYARNNKSNRHRCSNAIQNARLNPQSFQKFTVHLAFVKMCFVWKWKICIELGAHNFTIQAIVQLLLSMLEMKAISLYPFAMMQDEIDCTKYTNQHAFTDKPWLHHVIENRRWHSTRARERRRRIKRMKKMRRFIFFFVAGKIHQV